VAKARPRNGKYNNFYTPEKTKNYENLIKMAASQIFNKPLDNPIELSIKFKLPRPKRLIWKKKPMIESPCDKRPDIDNLVKAVIDGLQGVAFIDDAQIWKISAEKVYHAGDDKPETIIMIKQKNYK